ncbi:MAG: HAD family hydrolase [Nitrososphaerales archaeon]
MIKLVIFDASGTLLDDFMVTWKAVSKILLHFGKQTDDPETFRRSFRLPYLNYYIDKGITHDTAKFEVPSLYTEFYLDLIDEVKPFPEVKQVIESLSNMSIKLAVASQTPKEALAKLLNEPGIDKKFSVMLGLGDYQEPKPSPESVLLVLNKLGINSTEAIYVGDMAEDIILAKRAGVMPVAVYRNGMSYHTRSYLEKERPAFIINDLTELTQILANNA